MANAILSVASRSFNAVSLVDELIDGLRPAGLPVEVDSQSTSEIAGGIVYNLPNGSIQSRDPPRVVILGGNHLAEQSV